MAKKQQTSNALPEGQVLSQTGNFIKFETVGDSFQGYYRGEKLIRQKDGDKKKNQKKGDLMGFKVVSDDGEEMMLGAGHTIKTSLLSLKPAQVKGKGAHIFVRFDGVTKLGQGRKVNNFVVVLLKK